MNLIPRLRMFAGPNGSGKSTLKTVLDHELLGVYINPDEIEKKITAQHSIQLSEYNVFATIDEVNAFFSNSELYTKGTTDIQLPGFNGSLLTFSHVVGSDYTAAAVTAFIHDLLIKSKVSFTIETVMSHPSKIMLLKEARALGYRTYLYYVATSDPEININRVHNRVLRGGHSVPDRKIHERYERSLNLLFEAIQQTDRAYIFDNSIESTTPNSPTWIAEITDGKKMILKTGSEPAWFKKAVIDKIENRKSSTP